LCASAYQTISSNNSCAHDEQGDNPRQKKEGSVVSSINCDHCVQVLAALAWLKQIELASHWLVQHTAPVRAKPDSRPRLEGAHYRYQTSCSLLLNPFFPARHAHIYQFPSSQWASAIDRYTVSALRSRSRLHLFLQQRKKEERARPAPMD